MLGCLVKILRFSKEPAPSARLLVAFPSGDSVVIQWGIDAETYSRLENAFEEKYFDSMADHESFLPLTYETTGAKGSHDRKVYAYLEKVSGERRKQIKVECSEFFAGNLKWFQESVSEPKDLEHLIVRE